VLGARHSVFRADTVRAVLVQPITYGERMARMRYRHTATHECAAPPPQLLPSVHLLRPDEFSYPLASADTTWIVLPPIA